MRKILIATVVLGALAASAVAGGWRDLVGKPAPEVTAAQWLHVPGGKASNKSLKGKVWLLTFIGIH